VAKPVDARNDDVGEDELTGLDTTGFVPKEKPRGYTASGRPKGGKRSGAGRRGILAGGKRSFDPDTGWPTCYGNRCDKPATKLSVRPRADGTGADFEPTCADCSKGYTKSRPLSGPLLETWKKTDNETAEPETETTRLMRALAAKADKRPVDLTTEPPIHTVNTIVMSKSRPKGIVKPILDADQIKNPVTRAGARAARRRALDSNKVLEPKRRIRIKNKTSEVADESGPVTAIERDRAGLMGAPISTPGRPVILPTNIEDITKPKGGALAALGTTIAQDYRQSHVDELRKRRSPAEGDAILQAALNKRRKKPAARKKKNASKKK